MTVVCYIYKPINIYYVMLDYAVLNTSKTQVKTTIWSKDSHGAHLLTTIQ